MQEVTKEQMIEHLIREKGRTREAATESVNVIIREKLVTEIRPGVYIGNELGRQVQQELKSAGYKD